MSPETDRMVAALQLIHRQNVFYPMNVGWNTYPTHLGHKGDGGCFRCHNPDLVDEEGAAIAYDCTLCHSILALDSASEFQFLQPLREKDPDLEMHRFLRSEFLGILADEADWAPTPGEGETEPAPGS